MSKEGTKQAGLGS